MLTATIQNAGHVKKIATILSNLFPTVSVQLSTNAPNEDGADDAKSAAVAGQMRILMVSPCKFMLFDIIIELDSLVMNGMADPLSFSVNAKHFLESFDTIRASD